MQLAFNALRFVCVLILFQSEMISALHHETGCSITSHYVCWIAFPTPVIWLLVMTKKKTQRNTKKSWIYNTIGYRTQSRIVDCKMYNRLVSCFTCHWLKNGKYIAKDIWTSPKMLSVFSIQFDSVRYSYCPSRICILSTLAILQGHQL